MSKMGRPKIEEELSTKEIIEIMLEHATKGGFLFQLPMRIYVKTDVMVSLSYLDKIKDPDFLRAKTISRGFCASYWVDELQKASISPSFVIMVMKNVGDWRDHREVKLESSSTVTMDADGARKELQRLKDEIAESV